MSRPKLLLLALVAGLLFCGCGASSISGSAEMDLIQMVQNAPHQVRHSGIRRIESYYNLDGNHDNLVYRERVQTDGKGRFAITPLGSTQGGLPSAVAFKAVQLARAGFHQRYRDFLVRDLVAFLDNYELKSQSGIVAVAGRDCLQVDVARQDGSASYEVALDIETGLVLRYREFDATGVLYSMMEYESYDAQPNLVGVQFHQESNQESPLTTVSALGFQPLVPKLLPDSAFRFLEASVVTDPSTGTRMAKLTYTDGVETVFFLDAGPDGNPRTSAATPKASAGFQAAGYSSGMGPGLSDEVRVFHEGPLTVVWGDVEGHGLYLVGKASQSELLQMFESALP